MKHSFSSVLLSANIATQVALIAGCASGANVTRLVLSGPNCSNQEYARRNPGVCNVTPVNSPTPSTEPSPIILVTEQPPSPPVAPPAPPAPVPPVQRHTDPEPTVTVTVQVTVTATPTSAAPARPNDTPSNPNANRPTVNPPNDRPVVDSPSNNSQDEGTPNPPRPQRRPAPNAGSGNQNIYGHDCDPTAPNVEHVFPFEAQALSRDDLRLIRNGRLKLPYLARDTGQRTAPSANSRGGERIAIRRLNFGEATGVITGTDSNNTSNEPVSYSYLENTMMTFKFVTVLPKVDTVNSILLTGSGLDLQVTKISAERSLATEILCFVNERICSGNRFQSPAWRTFINPGFWGRSDVANHSFADAILALNNSEPRSIRTQRRTERVWTTDHLALSMQEMLGGAPSLDFSSDAPASDSLKRFVYSNGLDGELPLQITQGISTEVNSWVTKTFYGVVADDTLLRGGTLRLNVNYDACRARNDQHPSNSGRATLPAPPRNPTSTQGGEEEPSDANP